MLKKIWNFFWTMFTGFNMLFSLLLFLDWLQFSYFPLNPTSIWVRILTFFLFSYYYWFYCTLIWECLLMAQDIVTFCECFMDPWRKGECIVFHFIFRVKSWNFIYQNFLTNNYLIKSLSSFIHLICHRLKGWTKVFY